MDNSLLLACKNNQLSVIKILASRAQNINDPDNSGMTPFLCSVKNGNLDAVQTLLQFGADSTAADNYSNNGLHYAVVSQNCELLRRLCTIPGIGINRKNNNGDTPLFAACALGKRDMVQVLLEAGAVDEPNSQSRTALDAASSRGAAGIVELLLASKQFNPVPEKKSIPFSKTESAGSLSGHSFPKSGSTAPAAQIIKCSQCGNTDLDLSTYPSMAYCPHCKAKFIIVGGAYGEE